MFSFKPLERDACWLKIGYRRNMTYFQFFVWSETCGDRAIHEHLTKRGLTSELWCFKRILLGFWQKCYCGYGSLAVYTNKKSLNPQTNIFLLVSLEVLIEHAVGTFYLKENNTPLRAGHLLQPYAIKLRVKRWLCLKIRQGFFGVHKRRSPRGLSQ